MKLKHFSALWVPLFMCGCNYLELVTVIPLTDKVTSGHRYGGEAIAFLGDPATTRQDVLSNLGQPNAESKESRVLLYVWETTWEVQPLAYRRKGDPFDKPNLLIGPTDGVVQRVGLFIAYRDDGSILRHEVLKIGTGSLDQACRTWSLAPPK